MLFFGCEAGCFLVASIGCGNFRLSMCTESAGSGEPHIKHYRIRSFDDGKCFLSRRVLFNSIQELIEHYRVDADGLCCVLTRPCAPEKPVPRGLSKQVNMEWEIERKNIVLLEKVPASEGHFSEVWEGIWNNTTSVTVKTIKANIISSAMLAKGTSMKLYHPNLIQMYAVCTRESPFYIVYEFMKQNLLDYLQGDGCSLNKYETNRILTKISSGMVFLEESGCIHGNLAARNIFIFDRLSIKIADYGFIHSLAEDVVHKVLTGVMLRWTAPECIKGQPFTIQADVWSFGVVIYEVISRGKYPYPDLTDGEVFDKVQTGYHMDCSSMCHQTLYRIILECWRVDPLTRPTFEHLQWQIEDQIISEYID